jgi:hypothetical protein
MGQIYPHSLPRIDILMKSHLTVYAVSGGFSVPFCSLLGPVNLTRKITTITRLDLLCERLVYGYPQSR